MKVAIGAVHESGAALAALNKAVLPAATALRVHLVSVTAQPLAQAFGVTWDRLIAQMGTPLEGQPGRWEIKADLVEQFQADAAAMKAEEVELPLAAKLPFAALGTKCEIAAEHLAALAWMIELQE